MKYNYKIVENYNSFLEEMVFAVYSRHFLFFWRFETVFLTYDEAAMHILNLRKEPITHYYE